MTSLHRLCLSAHIGYLFADRPLAERAAAAARAGFNGIEHPQPFAVPAKDMRALLDQHSLAFCQLCAATGDASRGEKGLAAVSGREQDVLESLDQSLDYAEAIGCPFVHLMAGIVPSHVSPERAAETYLSNFEVAVERTRGRPVRILIVAIGQATVPGYHMHRLDQAFAFARAFAPGAVSVLLDTFHAAANGEDAVALIGANADLLGHIHIADHPGRHEPGTGSIGFDAILGALEDVGYTGAIGFEYLPAASTEVGLSWIRRWRERLGPPAA